MPRYAALIYGPAEAETPGSPEELAQVFAEYTEYDGKARAAGVVAGGEALEPTATATTVRVEGGKGGKVITTDGPFAETEQVLGGFYLFDCEDMDEALGWAAQIPGAWRGSIEVRPVVDFGQDAGA